MCCVQDGTVLGISLQPYESHIPFLLQFKVCLIDVCKARTAGQVLQVLTCQCS